MPSSLSSGSTRNRGRKLPFVGVFFGMERIQTSYWDGKKIHIVACTNTLSIYIVVEIREVLGQGVFINTMHWG